MNPAHKNEVLSRALNLKQHEFVKSGISLDLDLAEDLPKVLKDEHQLIQVIVNILTNAQQAMESIQRTRELLVRTTISGEKVRIRIQDSGPGIPPEQKMLIFEPFYTTKEVGMGTGLGLSICHGIIQGHRGAIWS
ncbi:MAG TPA: GHKL domain-containing protein, partial [Dehalococcoidia bacterium]|nr:GHKL domain-containing protein [Dehalococcoidia bacterium]